VGTAKENQVKHYNEHLKQITDFRPDSQKPLKRIRPFTLAQFAKIADPIEADEQVGIGIYDNGNRRSAEWHYLSKATAREITKTLEPVEYDGGIQAIIHSLFLETDRPYFRARELSSEELVTCYYPRHLYKDIVETLQKPKTVVHIIGRVKASRLDRQVTEIIVQKIDPAQTMTKEELQRFFGSAPNLTGNLSTEEFLARIRHGGEA
jgi:hypothetical protein